MGLQRPLNTSPLPQGTMRVSTSGLNAYCDGRHDQCVKDCLGSSRPFAIGYRKYTDTPAQPWRIARMIAGSAGVALVLVPVLVMAGSPPGMPLSSQREVACK
jgi:hypothetical protein